MSDFDSDKYRKMNRKDKFDTKKDKYYDLNEDERLQRKKISHLKNKKRQIEEDELWEEWKDKYK